VTKDGDLDVPLLEPATETGRTEQPTDQQEHDRRHHGRHDPDRCSPSSAPLTVHLHRTGPPASPTPGSAVEEGAEASDGALTVVGKELAEFSADCRAGVGEDLPGQIE
jgi:hypothetical protein